MMQPFLDIADGSENLENGEGVDYYHVYVKNFLQFDLSVGHLAAAYALRQSSCILLSMSELTGFTKIGCASDATVAKYARFAVAIDLQKIAELLEQSWTFSIALDKTTHMSTSYLDI
uniref:Uncharacterized protein n=1 Tax=Peronospora matthiolae TaxID=2874970 RepID=A0AAV1UCJ2_9STRA